MRVLESGVNADSRQIARVAHELTTPVSLISGSLENLQESLATLVRYVEATEKYLGETEEIARLRADLRLDHRMRDTAGLLEICAEGARRLSHVVAQLRTGAPAGAPKETRRARLRGIIDRAVAMAAHGRAKVPRVVITCSPDDLSVVGCSQSIGQVLLNVVRNAFDALDGQSNARVDIEAYLRLEGVCSGAGVELAVVSVRDNGPGVLPGRREQIFEEGFSSKADRGGLGLGLAISREIMAAMNGSLQLSPRTDGAEFMIEIPTEIRDPVGD